MTCSLSDSPQMQALKKDWLAQIDNDLQHAAELVEELAKSDLRNVEETSEALFRVFHDIQGQASVFNYSLMAAVAMKFCCYWRPIKVSPTPQDLPVARAHLVAARFILEKQLEGCGGQAGPSIIAKLDTIIGQNS